MNCKTAVSLLLVFCCGACLAQREGRAFRGVDGPAAGLYEDIMVLYRLAPLKLTGAQVEQLLAVYASQPAPEADGTEEIIAKLQEIKQRLLAGDQAVAADVNGARNLLRDLMQLRRRNGDAPAATRPAEPLALTPLEQALWEVLTVPQRAILLGDVRGPQANNQRADQLLGQRAVAQIEQMLQLDDAKFMAARDRFAGVLSAAAGPADSAQRANCRKMFVELLDRVRQMPPADFAARQAELAAELLALLPPGTNLAVALAEYDVRLIHGALAGTLTHPRAPGLLAELKAAQADRTNP